MNPALALVAFLSRGILLQEDDVDRWIHRLGDENLQVREEATRSLIEALPRAEDRIRRLLTSDDIEIRNRAHLILDTLPPRYELAWEPPGRSSYSVSPDGSAMALFRQDTLVILNLETGKETASFPATRSGMVRWTKCGLFAEIDPTGLRPIDLAAGTPKPAISFSFHGTDLPPPYEDYIPTSTGDGLLSAKGGLFVWYARTRKCYRLPVNQFGAISSNGDTIIGVGPKDSDDSSSTVLRYSGHGKWRMAVATEVDVQVRWCLAGEEVPSVTLGSKRGTLLQLECHTLKTTARRELGSWINALAIQSDGDRLFAVTADRRLHVIDGPTLGTLAELNLGYSGTELSVSENGSILAVYGDGKVNVYRRK